MGSRKSYEETCRQLFKQEYVDAAPPMLERMPRHDDDEPLGIQFFKSGVDGADFSDLSLPRTLFGRSEVANTTFRNSNLSESCLCWNDFIDVDFSEADLSSSDLRASLYERVSFVGAKLDSSEMRRSSFVDRDFTDASMRGAILTENQKEQLGLSVTQIAAISWTNDEGPEPDGG